MGNHLDNFPFWNPLINLNDHSLSAIGSCLSGHVKDKTWNKFLQALVSKRKTTVLNEKEVESIAEKYYGSPSEIKIAENVCFSFLDQLRNAPLTSTANTVTTTTSDFRRR